MAMNDSLINNQETTDLGSDVEVNKSLQTRRRGHVPSRVHPDTLFTFSKKLDYIIPSLGNRMVSPRYVVEDISYLRIKKVRHLTIPMKCFCDISLQKMPFHMEEYGPYGLAFTKEWGEKNGIQPVHYLNTRGELRKDISEVFRTALNSALEGKSRSEKLLENYLLHEVLYYKPYSGKTEKGKKRCFADECEWRYIPPMASIGYPQIHHDMMLADYDFNELSNSIVGNSKVSLTFELDDLKYIVLEKAIDVEIIRNTIKSFDIDQSEKEILMSKVLVWETLKGDF